MREFVAVIEFDEDIASIYNEVNGHGDPAPGEMLEREFGWLEQSGISLKEWALTDFDVRSYFNLSAIRLNFTAQKL